MTGKTEKQFRQDAGQDSQELGRADRKVAFLPHWLEANATVAGS